MTQQTLDAVYEDGVLKPLEALDLAEHQRVRITVASSDEVVSGAGTDKLRAWQAVFEGLSADEVAEIEAIALDRSRFMKARQ